MWDYLLFIYVIIICGVLIVGLTEYLEQPKNKNKMLVPSIWMSGPLLLFAFSIYYLST